MQFVPDTDGEEGFLILELSAETQNYRAPLVGAEDIEGKDLLAENGRINGLEFKKGIPIKLNVRLDYSDYCSMEVRAYAH